jgi:hypothetical protein
MCRDPFLTCLREFGYSVVRFPVADLEPLHLLFRRGDDFERFGRLATILAPGAQAVLPRVERDRPAPSISGRRTGRLDAGVGLSLLGGVVAAMGGSRLGLDEAYGEASDLTFEFREVTESRVELAALDRCLAAARLDRRAAQAAALLDAGDLYVTTAVVRCRALTVDAHDSGGASLSVDLPALERLAGGHLSVAHDAEDEAAVTYAGATPLAFGFRAVRPLCEGWRFTGFEALDPGEAGLRRIQAGRRRQA